MKPNLTATGRVWRVGMDKPMLPHLFTPRHYQQEVFDAWDKGYRRFITVWPRGGGKDNFWANFIACRMAEVSAIYKHIFPEKLMGRFNWWDEGNNVGFRFLDHFPETLCMQDGRRGRNEQEMSVTYRNGARYIVLGADEPNRLRGGNPAGVVFSEYAWCSKLAWPIIEPRILAREGWAAFNSTPDGRDESLFNLIQAVAPHLLRRFRAAINENSKAAEEDLKDDPKWFVSLQRNGSIVRDGAVWLFDASLGDDGGYVEYAEDGKSRVYSPEDIADMRKQGRSEAWIAQEVECSFDGEREGAYYGAHMMRARNEQRIGAGCARWDPRYGVSTAWDVGHTDHTSIWFFQRWGNRINLIDFHQDAGKDVTEYLKVIRERPYRYNSHWGPHDIKQHHFSAQKSAFEIARDAGVYFNVAPEMSFQDGINAVRMLLPRCCFESPACDVGIESLERYRAIFNKRLNEQGTHPVHDRYSHGADAFRYLALVADQEQDSQMQRFPTQAEGEFDVFQS